MQVFYLYLFAENSMCNFCLNLQFNLLKHNRLSYKPMTDLIAYNKINTYIINTCLLTDFQCYIICILKLKLKQYICITKIEHLASMALVDNLTQLWVFCNNYEFNCSISVIFKTNSICFKVCLYTSCIKEIITITCQCWLTICSNLI